MVQGLYLGCRQGEGFKARIENRDVQIGTRKPDDLNLRNSRKLIQGSENPGW